MKTIRFTALFMAFYFIVGIFPIGAVTANVTVLSKGDVNADALVTVLTQFACYSTTQDLPS